MEFDPVRITPAWLAGFFDGEGSICGMYAKQPRADGNIHKIPRIFVGLSQKNLPLLETVKGIYGGTLGVQRTRGAISCRHLHWYGRSALPLLNAIQPHLVVKREQADLCLEFLGMVRGGDYREIYRDPVTGQNAGLTPKVLAARATIVERLRFLNRRNLSDAKRAHYQSVSTTGLGPIASLY